MRDDEQRKTITEKAYGAVAGSADLAKHRVSGRATRGWPRKNPEFAPNKTLYPTDAGGIVSAAGKRSR